MNTPSKLLRAAALMLTGAVLGLAADLGASDGKSLAVLEARLAALERSVVVTPAGVELRGPGASLHLEGGVARLDAVADIQLHARRLTAASRDELAFAAGNRARLQMKKSGEVSLAGTDVDLVAAGRMNVRGSDSSAVKGSKIGTH